MNLLIRDFPDALADRIKDIARSSTLSKAVLSVASDHERLLEENARLRQKLAAQEAENQRLERVIEGARAAAVQLFERTSQTELRA